MRPLATVTIAAFAVLATIDATQATPIGGGAIRPTMEATNLVETIAYRRCWWRQGVRFCRRYRSSYYPYQPYYSGAPIGIIIGIR
jgi:hypothetical protein